MAKLIGKRNRYIIVILIIHLEKYVVVNKENAPKKYALVLEMDDVIDVCMPKLTKPIVSSSICTRQCLFSILV